MLDSVLLNNTLNPIKYAMSDNFKLGLTITKTVDDRSIILPFTDFVAQHSADPYIAIRSAIHQSREAKIKYQESFVCPRQEY